MIRTVPVRCSARTQGARGDRRRAASDRGAVTGGRGPGRGAARRWLRGVGERLEVAAFTTEGATAAGRRLTLRVVAVFGSGKDHGGPVRRRRCGPGVGASSSATNEMSINSRAVGTSLVRRSTRRSPSCWTRTSSTTASAAATATAAAWLSCSFCRSVQTGPASGAGPKSTTTPRAGTWQRLPGSPYPARAFTGAGDRTTGRLDPARSA